MRGGLSRWGLPLVGWCWALAWGWSNERLFAEYLACWAEPLGFRVDVFTSFRSIDDGAGRYSLFARDFYNSFLSYWPASLGPLLVFAEADAKTVDVVEALVGCLARACATPQVRVATYDVAAAVRVGHKVGGVGAGVNANFTSVDDMQMQGWKYVLDLMSDAEALAVLDDDACLQDHVLPRGDLAACDGRLVVRGVRFERRPGRPTKHERSNALLGVESDVNFMVDFPVLFWRGHLADFRDHVAGRVLGPAPPSTPPGDPARFWEAVRRLLARGWTPSEYSNLMGFALQSPKWRERYDFQIVPNAHRPVMAMASHKLGACDAPPTTSLRDRDADAFVDDHFETAVYPFDAKPYLGAKPGTLAENAWNGVVPEKAWAAYDRAVRDAPIFRTYLADRQRALRNYSDAKNHVLAPRDVCGDDLTPNWAACFRAVRTGAGAVWTGWNIYRPGG